MKKTRWSALQAMAAMGITLTIAGTTNAGAPRCAAVIDGDTIRVEEVDGSVRVHLWGVDAPELGQPWGAEARNLLEEIALDQTVELAIRHTGDDGVHAVVSVSGADVAPVLVEQGLAWLPLEGDTSDEYALKAIVARGAGVGCWSDADALHPALWREQWARAADRSDPQEPTSISDIAGSVKITRGEITQESGSPPSITNDSIAPRGPDIGFPDSPYGRCIETKLERVLPLVDKLRSFVKASQQPPNDGQAWELEADCRVIEASHMEVEGCSAAMRAGERQHLLRADWKLGDAVNGYGITCRYLLIHQNTDRAAEALANADTDLEAARTRLLEGMDHMSGTADTNR